MENRNDNNIDLKTGAKIARCISAHKELIDAVETKRELLDQKQGKYSEAQGKEVANFVCYLLNEIANYEVGEKDWKNGEFYAERSDWKDIPDSIMATAKQSGRNMNFFAREMEHSINLRKDRVSINWDSLEKSQDGYQNPFSGWVRATQLPYYDYVINKYKMDVPIYKMDAPVNNPVREDDKTQTYLKLILEIGGRSSCVNNNRLKYYVLGNGCVRNYAINTLTALGVDVRLEQPKEGWGCRQVLRLAVGFETLLGETFRKSAQLTKDNMISIENLELLNSETKPNNLLDEVLLATEAITSSTSDYEVMLSPDEKVKGYLKDVYPGLRNLSGAEYTYDVNNGIISIIRRDLDYNKNALSEEDKQTLASYGIEATNKVRYGIHGKRPGQISIVIDLNELKKQAAPVMKMS